MRKVFIDGKEGTTGLQIFGRLAQRDDIELLTLEEHKRKDLKARQEILNKADISFLCLPDEAAREAVALLENPNTKIIDTSTAHRTSEKWSYGFPELSDYHRERIINDSLVAVPGCHASGFLALVYPLVSKGVLPKNYPFVCFSVTGYSGGGKKMIAEYEDKERDNSYNSPKQYALMQQHKHLKEMKGVSGIQREPIFSPLVAPYYSGMMVTVPIDTTILPQKHTPDTIRDCLKEYYADKQLIKIANPEISNTFISANAYSSLDLMELSVHGNNDRILLIARYDNLGKGACGAALQCMNLMLSLDEFKGLKV